MKELEIEGRYLINPTDLDRRNMIRAKHEADRSRCDRSRFGCVIAEDSTFQIVVAHNEPPNLSWGLCGNTKCLRSGYAYDGGRKRTKRGKTEVYAPGETLEVSCVHAEMAALFKFFIAGLRGPATLYLYGDAGWSLPCAGCLKNLMYVGVKRYWLSGRHDVRYMTDVEIPKEWLENIEYGYIPYRSLGV